MLQLLFNDYSNVTVASPSSLCRARRKVDLAMMILRRKQWQDIGLSKVSIQLGSMACKTCWHWMLSNASNKNLNCMTTLWWLMGDVCCYSPVWACSHLVPPNLQYHVMDCFPFLCFTMYSAYVSIVPWHVCNGCCDCPGYDAATLDKEIFVVEEHSIRLVQVFLPESDSNLVWERAWPGPCHSIPGYWPYCFCHGDSL